MQSIQSRVTDLEKRAEPNRKVWTIIIWHGRKDGGAHRVTDCGDGLWTRRPDETHDGLIARARKETAHGKTGVAFLFALPEQTEAAHA